MVYGPVKRKINHIMRNANNSGPLPIKLGSQTAYLLLLLLAIFGLGEWFLNQ